MNGRNIEEYSSVASIRASHLPIYPAPAHPDSGKVLFLDNGLRLDKDTNVELKTRYLLPLSLINFRYCDHRTQQKYTLQSVSLDVVLGAVDSGQPAKYPAGIGDSPSLIGGPKKSIPSPPKHIPSPSKHIPSPSKHIPLPSKSIPSPSDSMRPTYTPRRPLAESSHNVRPVTYGTYLPKVTNFARADLPQEQSFKTPLLADVLQQHKRCHYNTDLERHGACQSTSSSRTVERTRSPLPSSCASFLFTLVFLSFFIFMAFWIAHAKA